jgi:hypothetical protein
VLGGVEEHAGIKAASGEGSAGVSPAAFGVRAECEGVRDGTLRTATGTVALPIQKSAIANPKWKWRKPTPHNHQEVDSDQIAACGKFDSRR